MFTGIIEQIGIVKQIMIAGENKNFVFSFNDPIDLKIGDSIAINGVCLTLTAIEADQFSVTAVAETLRLTNLALLKINDPVNLETALRANRSMGGHYVQGHVDSIAQITEIIKTNDSWQCTFSCSAELAKYIVKKGFITIDGMSITLVSSKQQEFSVVFIPHTIANTIVQFYQPHTFVNIEVDIMAKYIEKYLDARHTN